MRVEFAPCVLQHARPCMGSAEYAQPGRARSLSPDNALQQYIKKIRAATTQEERENIVFKELAKIRQKYSSTKKCTGAPSPHTLLHHSNLCDQRSCGAHVHIRTQACSAWQAHAEQGDHHAHCGAPAGVARRQIRARARLRRSTEVGSSRGARVQRTTARSTPGSCCTPT